MPRIVGLTGGIATGKSTVSSVWAEQGVTVIDADKIARQVVRPGRPAYLLIRRHFGDGVILPNGQLDRPALGRIVFGDARKRTALNRRIHPFIILSMLGQLFTAALIHWKRVIVLDAPLLFESGTLVPLCSRIVVVTAPRHAQLHRLLIRDKHLSEKDANQRIDSQMPLDEKVGRAHHVINNNGSREQLVEQAMHVMRLVQPPRASEFAFRAVVCAVGVRLAMAAISLRLR